MTAVSLTVCTKIKKFSVGLVAAYLWNRLILLYEENLKRFLSTQEIPVILKARGI